ncbi:MAG: hypothetical protein ACYDG4_10520 [Desulfuromonadaceae bacterium]
MKKTKKKKEGDNMPAVIEEQKCTFEEFITKNRKLVRTVAVANTAKDREGNTVIAKNDPWRNEHEWDEMHRKLKNKK